MSSKLVKESTFSYRLQVEHLLVSPARKPGVARQCCGMTTRPWSLEAAPVNGEVRSVGMLLRAMLYGGLPAKEP